MFSVNAASKAWGADVLVAAAASLTNAFDDIIKAYKTHTRDVIQTNYAASGVLLRQIEQGAPMDVFASADEATMQKAVDLGKIKAGTPIVFAVNDLVVIVPSSLNIRINTPKDLAQSGIKKIAVGNPESVPAGRYARKALDGVWNTLADRMVMAENVRQVLDYVSRGEAEAGVVYRTDAMLKKDEVAIALLLGQENSVKYPIAPLAGSAHQEEAAKFIEFVRGPQGREILGKYGFGQP
jgi:molybdate transport system substrate-binding protein